jgi:hypothetical protein
MLSGMRKRTALLLVVISLAVAVAAVAQAPARPVLSDADVKKFINDFKSLTGELEPLGLGQEQAPGAGSLNALPGILGAMQANAEAQKILGKYGWGGAQFQKFSAVFYAYLALKLEQTRAQAGSEIAAQLAEIERNPQVPAEQKAALKAQMDTLTGQLAQAEAAYKAQVHPDDLRTVRANEEALDAVSEE